MAKIKKVQLAQTTFGTWQLSYMNHRGKQRRISAGKDEVHAQRLRIKFLDWLMEGKDPDEELRRCEAQQRARSITLDQFFPVFFERHGSQVSQSMRESYCQSFKSLSRYPELLGARLCDVTKSLVETYRQNRLRLDGVKPATVNRGTAMIRSMLTKAVEWDILEMNPLQGLRKLKEAGKRNVRITPEQVDQLLSELPAPVQRIVEFAIYSGLRRENILSLRLGQVEFHDLTNTVSIALILKGNREDIVTLGGPAVDILREAIRVNVSGFIFGKQGGTGRYAEEKLSSFRRAVRRLKFTVEMDGQATPLRFHDLRHITATWGYKAGIPKDRMQTILGHKTTAMTERYTTPDQLAAAQEMEKLRQFRRTG